VVSAGTRAATCGSSERDTVTIIVVGVSLTGRKERAAAAPQLMWNFFRIPIRSRLLNYNISVSASHVNYKLRLGKVDKVISSFRIIVT
jgi:hypothetical protein